MVLKRISYMNAVRDCIAEEMRKNSQIIYFGEGVSERGGSYGQTKGLWGEFGEERIIDTPISENGFTAMAIGAAAMGMVPIVDIMFGDVICEILSPLAQQAGKLRYMSNGQISVPMVVRSQVGCKTNGPHHSASLYSVCMHVPGLKVIYPGNPYEAKGMMRTALNQKDTVIFCEDKNTYSVREEIPEEEYSIPLDQGTCIRPGNDVTVVSIGTMEYKIKGALAKGMISADIEIVNPRSLFPLNFQIIGESLKKTGRLVICEDGYLTCGAGAEIAARVTEDSGLCKSLKAPIVRVSSLDVPHPYAPVLEQAMMPTEEKIAHAIFRVME